MTVETSHVRAAARGDADTHGHAHEDYGEEIVPLSRRRSLTAMFLIWSTLQASVSVMFTGFLARSQGLSLGQLLLACGVATVAILLYGIGAANLGAVTGQTLALLARTIFGKIGSGVVSVLLIIMGLGWYGFQARFLAQMLGGLGTVSNITLWAVVFALLMTFNNLFGFRGVSAYARLVAAPILLSWGAYALIKGLTSVGPAHMVFASPHVPVTTTVMVIAGVLVGSAAWGNEPDLFRFSKGRPWWNMPALVGGYTIGLMLFPLAGYLIAELSTASDLAPFMHYLVDFSFFGVTALTVILVVVNQFALNDGNLYEAVNAFQNIVERFGSWRRLYSVLILGAAGAVLAATMSSLEKNFFIVAGISAVFVPCATTLMAIDVFVLPRVFGIRRPTHKVTFWPEAANGNWLGLISLAIGGVLGAYTGGLIPGIHGFGTMNIGFPALQAWLASAISYVVLVRLVPERRRARLLGFPRAETPALVEGADVAPVEVAEGVLA